MTPWWRDLIESRALSPVEMEDAALDTLLGRNGFQKSFVKADFWSNLMYDIQCAGFSDFVVVVRADMSHDIAHLLTWCLVETRHVLEAQYRHIPPDRSAVSYPLQPGKMAQSTIPLHPAAEQFYRRRGYLQDSNTLF